ncbi:hypothetical protein [Afipia carboxidovorans]|uniref:hypothetical protein n=1 Tax=Afipia carboxidovorans TaxID=40137 RepID=UPI00308E3331|nr:hypothetical protein CRBSH125_09560 [Afipia carboxidovorans]
MTEAIANLADAGSASAAPSISLDDAAEIDFFDPSEDNEDTEQAQQSEIETDEATESQEADENPPSEEGDTAEATDEGAEGESADANPEPLDDVTVTVNGEKLALSELKAGYMKEKDYRHKTTEVATQRKNLEALSARVTNSVDAIAQFLVSSLPQAPDPSLALTDPGAFVQQKAMHDAAMGQINAIVAQANEAKEVVNTLTAEQRKELLAEENAKLATAFPMTATQEGRQKFFKAAADAARELGFSQDEITKITDHRMFALAHFAQIGMRAEQAKAKAAKKVENKPPVAPPKRQHGANATQARQNKDAMKRLARTGSIDDALAIDFD